MAKFLIVVESPAKAKTIKKFVGAQFEVKASVGHIKDLPKNKLGVDIEHGFTPSYEVIRGKSKVIAEIKKSAKEADIVYLAPDPDREGEAIAWHIAEEIKIPKEKIFRVLFNEITKAAVVKAIKNPLQISQVKYEAQLARRLLDRLVGYQISPILWDKVRRGLSAGRVQSVAVRIIVEREREILAFVTEEYWTITARLQATREPVFEAKLAKIANKKAEIKNEAEARQIVEDVRDKPFIVKDIQKKSRQKNPPPPLITSTLQQEAARRLKFPAKKTMSVAQKLYEGVETKTKGHLGLITYMRTDSTRISDEATLSARNFIQTQFGNQYLPKTPNVFKQKKGAQDAHECIRPTLPELTPDEVKDDLSKEQFLLYSVIWERFICCQMAPAQFDTTAVDIKAGNYTFHAAGSVMTFDGFLKVAKKEKEESEAASTETEEDLPQLSLDEMLKLLELSPLQHFTQPPPRFTEATLVKELEEKGIGRPSTYATILSTIQDKEYAKKENAKFFPTELGVLVTDLLVENFPEILNVVFTATMEDKLDQIEEGQVQWNKIISDFYAPFAELLAQARVKMRNVKTEEVPTDIPCDKCGAIMVIKWGKNGSFLSCSHYPECKNTKDFHKREDGSIEVIKLRESGQNCELCGKSMVERTGKYGKFFACSGYPDCKNTKPVEGAGPDARGESVETAELCQKCQTGKMVIKKAKTGSRFLACSNYPDCKNSKPFKVGVTCPRENCEGVIVERASKRGKLFYGCNNYPTCSFVSWNLPVNRECPACHHPLMYQKESKDGKKQLICANPECKFVEVENPPQS